MTTAQSTTTAVDELAGRLRIVAGRLAREAGAQSRLDGMTPSRLAALAVLESDGALRVGALAERVGISAPTTSRLVDCLEERGLILRSTDPDDHRAIRVSLSQAGQAGLHSVRELGAGLLAERITDLDDGRFATLLAALPVLEQLAGVDVKSGSSPRVGAMTSTATLGYDDLPGLMTLMTGDEKHDSSATSTLDVLWVLHDRVLRAGHDRFLLSKGHGPMAYYAVLTAKGYLAPGDLRDFAGPDSILGHHPDRTLVPGVEIGSGSLGHGLGLAVGTALGLRLRGSDARTVVLVGDAELEEGSNAEAIQYAGRVGLDRLTAVVIDNSSASLGWPGGVGRRFAVEGWSTAEVDGRDHGALERAFAEGGDSPHAVIAHVEPKS